MKSGLRTKPYGFFRHGAEGKRLRALAKPDADSLVSYLNSVTRGPWYVDVERLIREMRELEQLAKTIGYDREKLMGISSGALGARAEKLYGDIWSWFQVLHVRASIGKPGSEGWGYQLYCEIPKKMNPERDSPEPWLISVFQLAFDGLIWRFRECEVCATWMLITRRDQKYCSGRCRERSFRTTAEGKARRATYMRRYRSQLRRRDRENLRVTAVKRGK
jgi:hypothetical protein